MCDIFNSTATKNYSLWNPSPFPTSLLPFCSLMTFGSPSRWWNLSHCSTKNSLVQAEWAPLMIRSRLLSITYCNTWCNNQINLTHFKIRSNGMSTVILSVWWQPSCHSFQMGWTLSHEAAVDNDLVAPNVVWRFRRIFLMEKYCWAQINGCGSASPVAFFPPAPLETTPCRHDAHLPPIRRSPTNRYEIVNGL